ncbi:MAG: hypothetical protein KDC82_07165, partial [Bacteroidetes bacterium]|nr:hypothetical protein [Bacteroidota bacterium]
MRKLEFKYANNYFFLIALFTLLINDFFLKQAFPGWLTGKLSDFAGLFFLPLFIAVFFPNKIKVILVISASFFLFWKSPLSTPLLSWINKFSVVSFTRVIDYSDWLALSSLALAYWVYKEIDHFAQLKLKPAPLLSLTALALMATSMDFTFITLDYGIVENKNKEELLSRIDSLEANLLNYGTQFYLWEDQQQPSDSFYLYLEDDRLCSSISVLGYLNEVDSFHTEIYFVSTEQRCNEKCGLFKR